MIVRMWEVRAYPMHAAAVLEWLTGTALPSVEGAPLHAGSEVFASADHRFVVLSRWHGEPVGLPDPPAGWVARAPHSWDFTPIDR
ncbi:hypothetical protein GCM10010124_03370 [Pilimelia terevasa]|uniref:Uncharacterized protein n=1 Tax=Pilimelia terevasa TaxID=53372 RepID=A0A8J3BIS5_9ACTN|nr:hypothetical protein [Pilimelia terevasa]GGK14091.1 hypothetical protein GCM10010124_03370 [Pilimelia terevasa]